MKEAIKIVSTKLYFLIIVFCGCIEIPPDIDFSKKVEGLKDTTYITSQVPVPIKKTIFIDDISGVRCTNCPTAAEIVHKAINDNPGKVIAVTSYPKILPGLTTPFTGFEDLRTSLADNIASNIFKNPSVLPTGGVNRKIFPGETEPGMHYTKWAGSINSVKTEESPIILNGKILSIDPITKKGKLNVSVIFAKNHTESVNLTIYITENKVISKQSMPSGPAKDDYEHNHVLRAGLTTFDGIPLKINSSTTGNYEAGRTFEKEFEFELDPKWKKENIHFVLLVNLYDVNNKEVLQAAEIDLQ